MQAPGITRHRRPFLAPIWLTFAAVLIVAAIALAVYRSATTTTVVVVRHAEKQLGTIDDPPLSPEGEARAERLARMLGDAGFGGVSAILVSDTRRSQQTAAPLAKRLRLQPEIVPARDIDQILTHVRAHRGSRVLIVGHSNTIPDIVDRLAGEKLPPIADGDYDDLYVVATPTFGPASVLRLTF
jgi:2,3-bisphosphoglycerate-dependent phosphoglycerate mutase